MNRSLSSLCLVALLLSLAPTFSARATDVAGTIAVDTTWTAAGNPWIVTGDVAVAASATLTIEAGVRVELDPRRSIMVVRSCVIYDVDTGIAVKDSSQALIVNNTISGADIALRLYQKVSGQGPGYATAWNNILWDNALAVELRDGSVLSLTYSNVEGSYFGDGNLNANPQFWNAASNDFRLAVDSPCVGTGENGATMGALFPVGSFLVDTDGDGLPDTWETSYGLNAHDPDDAARDGDDDGASNQDEFVAGTAPDDPDSVLKVSAVLPGPQGAELQFQAVDSKTYTLQFRDAPGMEGWQVLADVPASATTTNVTVSDPAAGTVFRRFYRLVTPALPRP